MKISKESRRLARELYQASLTGGHLDAGKSAKLTDQLISVKPRGYVSILHEYTRLVRLELARRHAIVESATPLSADETSQLQKEVPARFGGDLTMEFRTNPALLGGMRIQVGSDVWDGTVSTRLKTLSDNFNLDN